MFRVPSPANLPANNGATQTQTQPSVITSITPGKTVIVTASPAPEKSTAAPDTNEDEIPGHDDGPPAKENAIPDLNEQSHDTGPLSEGTNSEPATSTVTDKHSDPADDGGDRGTSSRGDKAAEGS